jgi:nucleotide-binding universal stress UspA family protein
MYQRILVPVDGSPTSQRGLEEAIRLAKLTQGRILLLHVIDELSFTMAMDPAAGLMGTWPQTLRESGTMILEEARAMVEKAGVEVDTRLHDRWASTVTNIVIDEAQSWRADLIVIGTHGRRGVGRLFLGSSAEQILRLAPVPVLLVRALEHASAGAKEGSHRIHQPTAALSIE